jgi:mRNA interferase MazF
VRQYELWWAALPAPIGRRPVLVLTRTAGVAYLNKLIVAEITRTIRGIPEEVPLGEAEGLPGPSVANLDDIHVVPKRLLEVRIGQLPPSRAREVKVALGFALAWPELKVL